MSGGGSSAPAAAPSTTTTVQDIPAWEQGYVTNLLGQAQTIAAQPYQQFPGQQVAGFTPDQTQAFSNVEGQQANINPLQSAATGQSAAGANTANNIYGAGSPLINASTMAATPQGIQNYMSPYLNNQIQGIQNEANLNWNQNIMPGINNEFVNAGQGASGRNAQVLGQAAGNFQTGLSADIANAENSAYSTAGNQAATEAGLLGQAGSTLGNLAATQGQQQLAAGTNLQGLATAQNATALTNNQALQAVGQQQQSQNQANLDTAQQNWQNQVNWPASQTEYLNQIIRGLPAPSAQTSASQSPANSVSPLTGIGGSTIGLAGLSGLTQKKGGLIKGYAEGGSVSDDDAPASHLFSDSETAPTLSMDDIKPESYSDQPSAPAQNPLDIPKAPQYSGISPSQMQSMQLLEMARGLLTPQPLGQAFSALGQGVGNVADTTTKLMQMQQQQQMMNYNMSMDRQRLGIEQQKADALSANSQEQRIKQLQSSTPGMTYDQAKAQISGQQTSPQSGISNVDPETGDVTRGGFGFNVSGIPTKVYNQMATEDSKRRTLEENNAPLGGNINRLLDSIEPNLNKFTTGNPIMTPANVWSSKVLDSQGTISTAAANLDKDTQALATEMQKYQYTPGMRGSVAALQNALASKPNINVPLQTNQNIVADLRSKVADYDLSTQLNQQYREKSPLKITDSNTDKLDSALKTIYPLQVVDPKTGTTIFNKDNVNAISSAIPDAIANPQKYFAMAAKAKGAGASDPYNSSNTGSNAPSPAASSSQPDRMAALLARKAQFGAQQ